MYNVFFKKQIVYFSYFNDLFLQRSPVRGSVRLQHPLVQRRPPVEVVCHPVVLHKLQKLSSPYELWLSLRVPPPFPSPILPKKLCIRHVASKKNEVTPYYCIFRFFNLSKFTSYGRISHWSTFGNLICRNLQLKMFYLLVQFSWMSYASYFKQPQSSCWGLIRNYFPQWGQKVFLNEEQRYLFLRWSSIK